MCECLSLSIGVYICFHHCLSYMLPTTFIQIQKKRRKWPHGHKQTFKHLSPKMRMFGTMLLKTDLSTWRSCLYLFKYSHLGQDQTRRATLVKLLECTLMKMNNSFYIKNFFIKIKHVFYCYYQEITRSIDYFRYICQWLYFNEIISIISEK